MGVVFIQNVFVTGPFPLVRVSGYVRDGPKQLWYISLYFSPILVHTYTLLTFALEYIEFEVSSSASSCERIRGEERNTMEEWDQMVDTNGTDCVWRTSALSNLIIFLVAFKCICILVYSICSISMVHVNDPLKRLKKLDWKVVHPQMGLRDEWLSQKLST